MKKLPACRSLDFSASNPGSLRWGWGGRGQCSSGLQGCDKKFARMWASSALPLTPPLVPSVPITASLPHGQSLQATEGNTVSLCSHDCRGEVRLGGCIKLVNPSPCIDTVSRRPRGKPVFPEERLGAGNMINCESTHGINYVVKCKPMGIGVRNTLFRQEHNQKRDNWEFFSCC